MKPREHESELQLATSYLDSRAPGQSGLELLAAHGPSPLVARTLRRENQMTSHVLRDARGRYDGYFGRPELEQALVANVDVLHGILQVNMADGSVFSPAGAAETKQFLGVLDLVDRYCHGTTILNDKEPAEFAYEIAAQIMTETAGSPVIRHVRQRELVIAMFKTIDLDLFFVVSEMDDTQLQAALSQISSEISDD